MNPVIKFSDSAKYGLDSLEYRVVNGTRPVPPDRCLEKILALPWSTSPALSGDIAPWLSYNVTNVLGR